MFVMMVSCSKKVVEYPIETVLSAVYNLDKIYSTPIKIHVKGKTSDMDIIHEAVFDTTKIPIHGLYQNYDNTVIITIEGKEFITNIKTPKLEVPKATIHVDNLPDPDPYNQDLYFISSILKGYKLLAYDRRGDIRFYGGKPAGYYFLHSIIHTNNQIYVKHDGGISDLLGDKIVDYKAQTNFSTHHDSIQVGDKYLVLIHTEWGHEDGLMELDKNGNIIRNFRFGTLFRDVVSEEDMPILNRIIYDNDNIFQKDGENTRVDWAHVNSLVYDKDTDIMYFSIRHQGVVAVDYSEWKLIWWLAEEDRSSLTEVFEKGYRNIPKDYIFLTEVPSLAPYRVTGAGATDGPKAQHTLFLLENGNIGMFDNQGLESENPQGSRYVEYAVSGTHGKYTSVKTREYRDENLYSSIRSDMDFTGEGYLLMVWANIRRIKEIDLDTDKIMFDISLEKPQDASGVFYRADKMPIYPYMDKNKAYSEDNNLKN